MIGKKIPLGTAVPADTVVKMYQISINTISSTAPNDASLFRRAPIAVD